MTQNCRKSLVSRACLLTILCLAVANTGNAEPGTYHSQHEFLNELFPEQEPVRKAVWLTDELHAAAAKILGHDPAKLRFRYWQVDERSGWVLDEIGKEKPITIGIGIENGKILTVRVLEFRESRGWEVRYPFFTNQFQDATLKGGLGLNKRIDNITGATLSVNAVRRVAALALYLHEHRSNTR